MTDFAAHTARMIRRLGRPVTVTPSGQPRRTVAAVFTASPAEAFGYVESTAPRLRLATPDAAGLVRGDAVEVPDVGDYTIASLAHDADAGDTAVRLEHV